MQLHANHDWPKRSAAILERGVEVNAAAADGTTALHLAAAAGFRESCRVLLQNGADRGQKNAAGATAIDAAKGGGHDQLAAFIDGWTRPRSARTPAPPIPESLNERSLLVRSYLFVQCSNTPKSSDGAASKYAARRPALVRPS